MHVSCHIIGSSTIPPAARPPDRRSVSHPISVFFRRQSQLGLWSERESGRLDTRSRSVGAIGAAAARGNRSPVRALSCSPENGSGWSMPSCGTVTAVQCLMRCVPRSDLTSKVELYIKAFSIHSPLSKTSDEKCCAALGLGCAKKSKSNQL